MKNKDFLEKIKEGATEVFVYNNKEGSRGPGTKQNLPFYNPSMQLNRDLSVVLCEFLVNSSKKELKLLDGLAASGIRGVRFANEIEGNFEVFVNDWNEESYKLIKKNIKKNSLENVESYNKNLNALLSEEKFDYIDIDPFGSPVYFIDSAMRSIKDNGVIALTATDTATLCGVYPQVCWRRYSAMPFHCVCMKEVGLRILIGFVCRIAGMYDKEIMPILSYVTDHYFRAYVHIRKGAKKANKSMKNLKILNSGKIGIDEVKRDIGPLWMGNLQDKKTVQSLRSIIFEKNTGYNKDLWKLLDLIEEESEMPMFFYTTDSLSSLLKKSSPKSIVFFEKLRKQGYNVSKTHFSQTGFKTDATFDIIKKSF